MQTTLAQFNETKSQEAFALQNSKLLKVRLEAVTVQAKLGSMVAYQGDVTFEHAGSGGLGRMLKKAVTGEGIQLMKVTGSGEVFLADTAQDIHLIHLDNDYITVNGPNLLAFDAGIDWDIKRVEGGSGVMGGGLYNMSLHGTGWVAIISDGPPVLLNVAAAPTFADAQAAITWSSGVTTGIKTDFKMKNLIGKGSGESIQMSFSGQGWVLVQPSEGRVSGFEQGNQNSGGGGLGSLLSGVTSSAGRRLPSGSRRPRPAAVSDDRRPKSHIYKVVVARFVDDDLAGGTPPARLERRPACRVAVGLGGRAGARPPVGEEPERAGELPPGLAELVREPGRALGVELGDHERLLGQRLQAGAEDVRRDSFELFLQLVEPLRSLEQRGDHEQRPAIPDAREGVVEGRGGGGAAALHFRK